MLRIKTFSYAIVTLLKKNTHTTTTGAAEAAKTQQHIHYIEKYNNIVITSLKLADKCNFALTFDNLKFQNRFPSYGAF